MQIEIGGGHLVAEGWINIDPVHGSKPEFRVKVQDGIALPDNSVEWARASHVMEHIPPGDDTIKAMNEVYRVLVPGGTFEVIVPTVGYTDEDGVQQYNGWQAWADYTHCRFFWYPESFLYMKRGGMAANADYGLQLWDIQSMELRDGWEARVVFQKPTQEA